MKRTLVTGACGFVGANLARRLLQDRHQVHLLCRPESNQWRIEDIRRDVQVHTVPVDDADAVTALVRRIRPEWIFHLAAHGAYSSQQDVNRMVQTNIVGTVNLVNACLETGFESLVNTGSSSEYGFKDHSPQETEWLEPNSTYAVTKAAATLFCRQVAQSRSVHIPTLRLYSVFGPYEEPSRLIPTLILNGLHGALPPLVDPNIARDFVYTDDAVEAYILAAAQPDQETGAVYNVGSGTQTSLRDVVETARRLMTIPDEPQWGSMPNRRWDTTCWVADNRKIRSELDWHPRFSFEQGFATLVEWFEEHPALRDFYEARCVVRQ